MPQDYSVQIFLPKEPDSSAASRWLEAARANEIADTRS